MRKIKFKEVTPQPLTELRVISNIDLCSLLVIYEETEDKWIEIGRRV